MSSLFSRRDRVDVPPVRAPREGGRTRMAGERPSRTRRRRRSEERQRSIEEAFEKRRRGRRSRRRGEEERSRSRSRGLVGGRRKNPKPPKDKGSEVVLDTFMGSGSSGVSAKKNYRNYIGIEINKEYYDIAKRRIDDTFSE